ncbi:hypothetical protein E4656_02145 [Natronospirillum operosum]|uniref:Sulfotransferase family protein n=1 Tax=Natronospirillum operosum TaxID=2759953 RepID=A0A4Z0WBQ4_9GAMM|nr:sulfotransferase family 2 domain-containing protein [Natronospirillum operosum]TGG95244.1 hypothetical protein E4656_02145 [Natronospirillum operosum]
MINDNRPTINQLDPLPFVDPVNRYLLFINSKCGGTTIKYWFFRNVGVMGNEFNLPWLTRYFGIKFALQFMTKMALEDRATRYDNNLGIRSLTKIYRNQFSAPFMARHQHQGFRQVLVCRNPYDRVVSGFIDKFCGDDKNKPWVREIIEHYGSGGAISFNQFLDHLLDAPEEAHNRHWRRQTYIIDGQNIDAMIRLEHLLEDFEANRHLFGDADFGPLTSKSQSNQYAASFPADINVVNRTNLELVGLKNEHQAFPPKKQFLNDETIGKINRIYAEDFERLPYSPT